MTAYYLPPGTIVKIKHCVVLGDHQGNVMVRLTTATDLNGVTLSIPSEQLEVDE